ncbi:DUF4283 domain protein [Medicago truncatula]|uniref:DUF4283 domain protein n=1 Tax=Medicago truncatula TaxID=3880 RepID=A0A072TZG9_MEDTR|nr:DUF4283 domain protein [Medicago truncatula]
MYVYPFENKDFDLKPGLLNFFLLTHAQLWVRLLHLPQEYWRKTTLFEIASGLGTPLSIDEATQSRLFGHYAHVLVDVDMFDTLFETVLVEREGYAFPMNVEYERQPAFFPRCKRIGHSIQFCNQLKSAISKRAASELESLQSKFQTVVPPLATNSQGTSKEVDVSLLHPEQGLVFAYVVHPLTLQVEPMEGEEDTLPLCNSFDMLTSEELKDLDIPIETVCSLNTTSSEAPIPKGTSPSDTVLTLDKQGPDGVGRMSFPNPPSLSIEQVALLYANLTTDKLPSSQILVIEDTISHDKRLEMEDYPSLSESTKTEIKKKKKKKQVNKVIPSSFNSAGMRTRAQKGTSKAALADTV